MYQCYKHSWFSDVKPCPSCNPEVFETVTTTDTVPVTSSASPSQPGRTAEEVLKKHENPSGRLIGFYSQERVLAAMHEYAQQFGYSLEQVGMAWGECATYKGWVTDAELEEKKKTYLSKLKPGNNEVDNIRK